MTVGPTSGPIRLLHMAFTHEVNIEDLDLLESSVRLHLRAVGKACESANVARQILLRLSVGALVLGNALLDPTYTPAMPIFKAHLQIGKHRWF